MKTPSFVRCVRGALPCAVASLFLLSCAQLAAAQWRPNVIFILADDLGYGELGCYGQKVIQTPNIDRMAAEGMRFTQFYAGSTVCAPSRSVFMTGQHTGHTRVRGNAGDRPGAQRLTARDRSIGLVMHAGGYLTGMFGKWSLGYNDDEGAPRLHGWDTFYGFLNQTHAHNHYSDFVWSNETRVDLPNVVTHVGPTGAGYATKRVVYVPDLLAEEALKFVVAHQKEPFFVYWPTTLPHANNERARALGDGQEVPDYGPYADRDWPSPLKGQVA